MATASMEKRCAGNSARTLRRERIKTDVRTILNKEALLNAVLITGGAGYIGSHTAKVFARSRFEPIVLDDLSKGHSCAVKWGPLVKADIGDHAFIREVITRYRIEAVVHFAADAYVGESMREPRQYFHNNVSNTLALLEAVLGAGIRYFVFSSSCATYGIPETVPIPENQPQLPVNPYGESKRFVERALWWYGEAYGLKSATLRYFNAAGADPEGELGEDHDPETHLVPLVIQAALGIKPRVEIYGTDYPTPDGTAIRDYIHVSDLAEAHVLALLHLMDGGENTALNLGTGRGYSIREVIAAVSQRSGRHVPLREVGRRPGDPPVLVADPALAKHILGWRPQCSDLATIVDTALRWQVGHFSEANLLDSRSMLDLGLQTH
jgi:UDP-glucose-4-epimerase GalE